MYHYVPEATILVMNATLSSQIKRSLKEKEKAVIRILMQARTPQIILDATRNEFQSSHALDACETLNSKYKLRSFSAEHFKYPNVRNLSVNGVKNVVTYVSIIDTLKVFLEDSSFNEAIHLSTDQPTDDKICDVSDGAVYKVRIYIALIC